MLILLSIVIINLKFDLVNLKAFEENVQFIFLCSPQKSSVNVCIMKILKSTVTKKVIVCFYNLGEEVVAFIIFPTSIMVLFETHQRFKGHFLNELRVSFKNISLN